MSTIRHLGGWAYTVCERQSVLRFCIRTLYACLRLAIPTDPRLIAFQSRPDCSDNAYALFEQVMKSPRAREFRLVWMAMNVEAAERILRRDYPDLDREHVEVVGKNTLRGLFWFLRSRYVFLTSSVYRFALSGFHQTIVNLWHGMPIKTICAFSPRATSEFPAFAHYSVATSEFYASLVAQAFSMPRDRVLVTGLPRNEWLFQRDLRHAALRDGRSRLVVWLPTFRQVVDGRASLTDVAADSSDPITAESLAELDHALDGADVLLVLKLHVVDGRRLRAWPQYKNIRVYTSQRFGDENLNVYKLLACADSLVTDYSSIAIDYLLLRKPIGFFVPDIGTYTRGFMPGVWERVSRAGPQLRSLEDLAAFVREPQFPPPVTPEVEDLHRRDLHKPSTAILHAVGLGMFEQVAGNKQALRVPQEIRAGECKASQRWDRLTDCGDSRRGRSA